MEFASKAHMMRYIEGFRVNHKTEMCKTWMAAGECEFGNECAFAHGVQELQ